eukprot:gnl/Trimastix_PCT/1376.p1 GENE.gnl/Trimastix_PCT/1376~~gnl/Trimastix_PCT/1376.p1  ORF type:complete len:163 (-),score=0.96 gnl/Trimastix_PCT/1376:10-432(-)
MSGRRNRWESCTAQDVENEAEGQGSSPESSPPLPPSRPQARASAHPSKQILGGKYGNIRPKAPLTQAKGRTYFDSADWARGHTTGQLHPVTVPAPSDVASPGGRARISPREEVDYQQHLQQEMNAAEAAEAAAAQARAEQ